MCTHIGRGKLTTNNVQSAGRNDGNNVDGPSPSSRVLELVHHDGCLFVENGDEIVKYLKVKGGDQELAP